MVEGTAAGQDFIREYSSVRIHMCSGLLAKLSIPSFEIKRVPTL
jgi:hypothetical protein